MDFSIIFQLRNKKFWWMDVIFYFMISVLVATVLCYFVFLIKNNMQRNEIKDAEAALQTVGTDQQKNYEKEVISYQRKIADFARIFRNHEFASNAFVFLEKETRPNVWFKNFSLAESDARVQVSGEADDMEAFARQVAVFEGNEYVKNLDLLNSTLNSSARTDFNLSLSLNQKIFSYIAENQTPIVETASPSEEANIQAAGEDSAKLITLFNIPALAVAGAIDQANHVVTLNVPFGADVKSLAPVINVSTGAAVNPLSGTAQDFTNPVVYTVTAKDGSTQAYTASVTILPKSKASNLRAIIIWIIVLVVLVAAAVLAGFMLWRRKKMQNNKNEI